MKQLWYRERPALLAQLRQDVEEFCSTLHVFNEGDRVTVRGTFPVLHEEEILDRYAIRIDFPDDYPNKLPVVREVNGRIPWVADRHVFVAGNCCVLLDEERWWSLPPSAPFRDYLRGPLHNYFLGQTSFESEGHWPFGEHDHGAAGIINFLAQKFGTDEPQLVVRFLTQVATGAVRGHLPCSCESGNKARKCHPGVIEVARRIPATAARESLDRLTTLVGQAKQC